MFSYSIKDLMVPVNKALPSTPYKNTIAVFVFVQDPDQQQKTDASIWCGFWSAAPMNRFGMLPVDKAYWQPQTTFVPPF